MNKDETDWPAYVKTMAALHGLELDEARQAEVVVQLGRIHGMARRFLDFPLDAAIEPAPIFHP